MLLAKDLLNFIDQTIDGKGFGEKSPFFPLQKIISKGDLPVTGKEKNLKVRVQAAQVFCQQRSTEYRHDHVGDEQDDVALIAREEFFGQFDISSLNNLKTTGQQSFGGKMENFRIVLNQKKFAELTEGWLRGAVPSTCGPSFVRGR